jgi:hypothetical protein
MCTLTSLNALNLAPSTVRILPIFQFIVAFLKAPSLGRLNSLPFQLIKDHGVEYRLYANEMPLWVSGQRWMLLLSFAVSAAALTTSCHDVLLVVFISTVTSLRLSGLVLTPNKRALAGHDLRSRRHPYNRSRRHPCSLIAQRKTLAFDSMPSFVTAHHHVTIVTGVCCWHSRRLQRIHWRLGHDVTIPVW